MKMNDKPKWAKAMANNIGRLFQGIRDIEVTDTCFFIHRHEYPQDIKVAYICIVYRKRSQKKKTHRVLLKVGDEKLTYCGPVFTPTLGLTMAKLHWNSVLYCVQ